MGGRAHAAVILTQLGLLMNLMKVVTLQISCINSAGQKYWQTGIFELDGCRVRDASSDRGYPIWKEGTCTVLMVAMQYSTSIKFCFLAVDAPWLATSQQRQPEHESKLPSADLSSKPMVMQASY
ncbi:hypothetical protein F5878DRAFT_643159 [Lentinula raphanica]|uniref:Uncharacterized protein n=1 Tax=Lentinula raphanica TaxID=153919 RepID=A0AA38P5Y7_9AGAR|nr:hypothetical protein F5878DRAFT_643159 [Lentinula raphanica]